MKIDIDKLILTFRQRDTKFRPPVTSYQWQNFEQKTLMKVSLDFKMLYSIGDGFVNYDEGSQIRLWSLVEILDNDDPEDCITNKSGWIAIGDFLINSDVVAMQIEKPFSAVKLLSQNTILAENINEFIVGMAAGRFDF